jgi:hypothetical protein
MMHLQPQSPRAPDALTAAPRLSISLATNASKPAGVVGAGAELLGLMFVFCTSRRPRADSGSGVDARHGAGWRNHLDDCW